MSVSQNSSFQRYFKVQNTRMRIAWKIVCMSMLLIVSRASSEESCFCNVYGNTLEDCSCTANTIETFNDQIHSKLQKVLTDDYFR